MVSAAISVAGFLDSTVYFTSVTYLGMTWLWTSRGRETFESLPEPANKPAHFVVRHTGRTERIKAELIVLVSAAGNFAELVCKDGSTVLHHLRLGQIMENPPAGFVRVHRSYAVNLKHVQSLKSREGSRYSLLMEGEHEVPVSRYRVSELRKTLAHE